VVARIDKDEVGDCFADRSLSARTSKDVNILQ
jgi:hypothetical protein